MSTSPDLRPLNEELNPWIRMAEGVGAEFNVTLLVSGAVVTGWLTPLLRYRNWATEVLQRMRLAGGKVTLPIGRMAPIGLKEIEQAKAQYETLSEGGTQDVQFPIFCLRNAQFRTGLPAERPTHSYVVIATDAVSAFTLGAPNEEPQEPPAL
jgi:hypothetical protein